MSKEILGGDFEGAPSERAGHKFHFNPKGKCHSRQCDETLKQGIAESARKAGLDRDMGIERTIKVRC